MSEVSLDNLVDGVIARISETDTGGLALSVVSDGVRYVLQAEACHCGKPCDMTHIVVTKISG